MKNLTKTEKRIPRSEYVNNEWYEQQLAEDWYIANWDGEYLVMRRMSENGYGSITAPQASLMRYASVYQLSKSAVRILLGELYDELVWSTWDTDRQAPLREYELWLSQQ